jgi:phage gp37-like protein
MIGAVENAMLARIKAASDGGVIPYAYRALETWPKDFDEYLSSRTVSYPAAWASFGGVHKIERVAKGRWKAHAVFGMVVAAENKRNEQATRHGGTAAEPGSYQLASDVVRILGDQRLGLGIDPFMPTSVLPVETSDIPKVKQVSIYAVSFDTALYFETEPSADMAPFKTLHTNWDPAPYGHVVRSEPLPQDANAIASDQIEIEECS